MSFHDDYGRVTPYELSVPGREFAEQKFREVEEEAEERRVDLRDPGAFVLLGTTGALLDEVRVGDEDPELAHQYGVLFFHAYHFWKAGEPAYLMETGVARYLVEAGPAPADWGAVAPGPAGYVQLPRHLFWSRQEEESPAEPLDGFFWTLGGPEETVSLLVAMGMRDDRPGLSVVALPPLPLRDAGTWMRENAREEGEDFASELPGGELERLYSVMNTGEVLKLAARTFWYLDRFSATLTEQERRSGEEERPRPSTLPFRRIRLRGDDEETGGAGE